jgi:hypothetical protein
MKSVMVKKPLEPTVHAVDMPPVSIENYVLWLFVAGNRPQSLPARRNIEQICEFYFKRHCEAHRP